jgi:hypothetical protein
LDYLKARVNLVVEMQGINQEEEINYNKKQCYNLREQNIVKSKREE